MAAELNHTIVWCTDRHASATFLAQVLSLPEPKALFHFMVVQLANGVSIDFADHRDGQISPQHYAFLVDDARFDAGLSLIRAKALPFWADPGRIREGEINHSDGGRGVYFPDPDGHLLEMLTTPYGTPYNPEKSS